MTLDNPLDGPEAAADLIALLADEGVADFFINPGTDSAPIQEALAAARAAGTPSPRAVLCVDESVALAAAIGHQLASRSRVCSSSSSATRVSAVNAISTG
nr:thiamine pyrophosphate-binding protein [Mycobacterium avium]